MSENSILKKWLTHIPFGVFIFAVMMGFALLASLDAQAEPYCGPISSANAETYAILTEERLTARAEVVAAKTTLAEHMNALDLSAQEIDKLFELANRYGKASHRHGFRSGTRVTYEFYVMGIGTE